MVLWTTIAFMEPSIAMNCPIFFCVIIRPIIVYDVIKKVHLINVVVITKALIISVRLFLTIICLNYIWYFLAHITLSNFNKLIQNLSFVWLHELEHSSIKIVWVITLFRIRNLIPVIYIISSDVKSDPTFDGLEFINLVQKSLSLTRMFRYELLRKLLSNQFSRLNEFLVEQLEDVFLGFIACLIFLSSQLLQVINSLLIQLIQVLFMLVKHISHFFLFWLFTIIYFRIQGEDCVLKVLILLPQ